MSRAALLDLDGTLIDANYQHALAWYRAFRRFEIVLPVWRLHRHIGMGGDQYVAAVAGDDVEARHGDDLRDAHGEEFERMRDECEPLEGAGELLAELKRRGSPSSLASSSSEDDLEFFVGKLGARDCIDGWTSKDDVERTKPHPDPIEAALEKAGTTPRDGRRSRWDIEAAAKAGLQTSASSPAAGPSRSCATTARPRCSSRCRDLVEHLDETPLG